MLTSLFGDLGPPRDPDGKKPGDADPGTPGFVATAIMESVATEVNARGQMVDRHSHDLVVTGSPAQAIRDHFAATRSDLDTATSLITLLDPTGVWASAVIKALSDASGRPVERLHLREHSTLRTLATIERTTLVRRQEDTLRIYHADVRAPGSDNAEIPVALMERSQLTTVIIGTLQPHAIDALLDALNAASMLPSWRCPNLLFLLPPNATWMADRVVAVPWPGRLRVHVISESMSGASSVWNAMLGLWNQVKEQPGWEAPQNPALFGMQEFPIKVSELDATAPPAALASSSPEPADASRAPLPQNTQNPSAANAGAAAPGLTRVSQSALDPTRARLALRGVLSLDGLLGCAIVDAGTGMVLSSEVRDGEKIDIQLAGAACAQVLRAHRSAARSMGLPEQIDEVMTTAGPRHQVMRLVSRHPDLFLIALLDRQRTNLALARFHLMEVERGLL